MGQGLAEIGGNGGMAERKGEGGRGWRVWRKTRMGGEMANPVTLDRARGYKLGSFSRNEAKVEKAMKRGLGGLEAMGLAERVIK